MSTPPGSGKARKLDEALDDTFPASDPPSMTSPVAATPSRETVPQPCEGDLRVYRVIEADQASEPFAPNDSGGRWTSPGVPCVYAALTPATALLEYLVHLEGRTPDHLLLATGAIPGGSVLAEANAPSTWCEMPYRSDVRQVGDGWIGGKRSLALRVPSAICMDEANVLLNPEHPQFATLQLLALRPLTIDPRLRT